MRAVRFDEFDVTPAIVDVAAPECPPRGVVVAVKATGLCRSDWHAWVGHDDDIRLPHIPGHEFAGVVHEVGAEVPGWAVGDRVTAPFVYACGTCAECASGNGQVCENQQQPGFTLPGSFAEFAVVLEAETNLVRLPEELGFVEAAALGCRFATAFRAVVTQGRLQAGEWVSVFGCGGVGLSAIMIAVALGAHVVAVDVSDAALARAEALGAIPISAQQPDVAAAVRAATDGGTHLSVDALGSLETSGQSVRSLRKRGRHVQVGLMLGDQALAPVPMDLVVANELELLGSHGMAAHEYPAMLDLIASGALKPLALVGRTIGLDEAPDALATMATSMHAGMTVITLP
ncbi:MAG TPA: zinc-dependent alcohol dehydrogenase family protein [Terrimesophilobacter sp.]|nr:zinc-dependent alcohol dehydrogenase family protein [Terrimesophilobacter sp.]